MLQRPCINKPTTAPEVGGSPQFRRPLITSFRGQRQASTQPTTAPEVGGIHSAHRPLFFVCRMAPKGACDGTGGLATQETPCLPARASSIRTGDGRPEAHAPCSENGLDNSVLLPARESACFGPVYGLLKTQSQTTARGQLTIFSLTKRHCKHDRGPPSDRDPSASTAPVHRGPDRSASGPTGLRLDVTTSKVHGVGKAGTLLLH